MTGVAGSAVAPPSAGAAARSAPVFERWIRSSSDSDTLRPSASRSSHCPPTMPAAPAAAHNTRTASRRSSAPSPSSRAAASSTRHASGIIAAPAAVATAAP